MSKSKFKPHKSNPKNNWTSVPNDIIRSNMNNSAFRLLVYLQSNTQEWDIYQSYIQKELGWGEDMMASAIKNLKDLKYLKIEKTRNDKGNFDYSYEFSWIAIEEEENSNNFTIGGFPTPGSSTPGSTTPGLPPPIQRPTSEDQYTKNNTRNTQASLDAMNACHFNQNLKSKFQALEVEFEDDQGKTHQMDQQTKEMIMRMHTEEQIENAMSFMSDVYEKSIPKNPIGMFRKALKEGWTGRTDEEKKCFEYFEMMKKERKLHTLQAYETHIVDTATSKDLTFKGMSFDLFKRRFLEFFIAPADAPKWKGI